MNKYVNREDVFDLIDKNWQLFDGVGDQVELRCMVSDLPSIDIVFCKECKHNPWNVETDYTCVWDDDFADRPQTPDDFCSYGERR